MILVLVSPVDTGSKSLSKVFLVQLMGFCILHDMGVVTKVIYVVYEIWVEDNPAYEMVILEYRREFCLRVGVVVIVLWETDGLKQTRDSILRADLPQKRAYQLQHG